MSNDEASSRSLRSTLWRATVRILARSVLFYVLLVFAAPCAVNRIYGRVVEPPIVSPVTLIYWGIACPIIATILEVLWHCLIRRAGIRSAEGGRRTSDRNGRRSDNRT